MAALVAQYGVLIVAAIIFGGEIGLPTLVPGEIALAIAGSQIVHSVPGLMVAAIGFGLLDVVATSTIHIAARTGGHHLLVRVMRRLLREDQCHEAVLERWRLRLGDRDAVVVFVTRMIPMFRLYASITTGLVRIRLRHFLMGAAPASLLWASIWLTAGYLFRGSIHGLATHYAAIMQGVIGCSVGAVAVAGATWLVRRKALSSQSLWHIRMVLGSAAVCGAIARLFLVALGGRVGPSQLSIPPIPTPGVWTCVLSSLALGLLGLVARDLHRGRTCADRTVAIGGASAAAWMLLVLLVAAFSSVVGVQHPTA